MSVRKYVRAHALEHRFPGGDALFRDLSFELRTGGVTALCDSTAGGRSTLLSILAGWEAPTAGRVETTGIGRTGCVFRRPRGIPGRSALDHVAHPLLARGRRRPEAREIALGTMAVFGLAELAGQAFGELSAGECQRLMMARAVCSAPDLLLVDEPSAELDRRTADAVQRALDELAEGTVVVVATGDPRTRAACATVVTLSGTAVRDTS